MAGLNRKAATQSGVVPAPVVTRREITAVNHEALIPGFGNVTAKDMIVPRLSLLQGMSPLVQEDPRHYFPGEFYHSVLGEMMGKTLKVVPLQVQRSLELWAPRDMGIGLLARSTDGIHWDKPHTKFEVVLNRRKILWDTKGSVGESGLADWGSSDPQDPKSPPAATLTYRTAFFLMDHPELGPCLMISAKTATRGIQDLITRVQARHLGGTSFHSQQYQLASIEQTKNNNKWYVPTFRNDGNVTDSAARDHLAGLAQAMATMNIRAEGDDRAEEEAPRARADNVAY